MRIVHCKKGKFDVYIGRRCYGMEASKWANPWKIGPDGTREEVIKKYETALRNSPKTLLQLGELKGKVLGCWCNFPQEDCHGRVLLNLLKEMGIE